MKLEADNLAKSLHPLSVEEILRAHYFEFQEVSVSPDDKELLVVFGNLDMPPANYNIDERNRSIWSLSADGQLAELATSREDAHSPAWSPDQKTIAFLGRGSGRTEIWTMDSAGENKRQVSHSEFPARNPFDQSRLHWSPNGTTLACSVVPQGSLRSLLPLHYSARHENPPAGSILVEGKDSRPVWGFNPGAGPMFEGAICLFEVATGQIRELVREVGPSFEVLGWWPDAEHLLITRNGELAQINIANKQRVSLYTGKRSLIHLEGDQIRLVRMKGSQFEWGPVMAGELQVESSLEVPGFEARLHAWSRDGSFLFGTVRQGVSQQLFAIDIKSSTIEMITAPGATANAPVACLKNRAVLYQYSAPVRPQELWTREPGVKNQQVTNVNGNLDSARMGNVQIVEYSSHGWDVEALLVLPKDFEATGTHPALIFVHGGPESYVSASFEDLISARGTAAAHWLTAHGYVVLMPNFRGSKGYGQAFQNELGDYRIMSAPFEDVMAGVAYLVDNKICDPGALGIYGSSFGAAVTAWAITQTDRFRGAVAAVGVNYDVLAGARAGGSAFHALTPNRLGNSDPNDMYFNPSAYDAISPMEHIGKVKTPLLLIETGAERAHGGSGARPFFNGLCTVGVEAYLAYYPDAFHNGGWNDEYKSDYLRRLLAWFDHCLKGDELPEWFAKSVGV